MLDPHEQHKHDVCLEMRRDTPVGASTGMRARISFVLNHLHISFHSLSISYLLVMASRFLQILEVCRVI